MATLKVIKNKVIIEGHENVEECSTLTNLANVLSESNKFKTIEYKSGYGEFESLEQPEDLKFAPAISNLQIFWDSHITSVYGYFGQLKTWTTSGEDKTVATNDTYILQVVLEEGYIIDNIDHSNLRGYEPFEGFTDTTFTVQDRDGLSFNGSVTITSKAISPAPSGYSITFEENGGTSVTDLTEQPNLPNPLPTTTKANHVFVGWYYDNLFTQKATPGDELTTNVTLYAKWYTPTTWCEDIADAIREKEGTAEPIKHLDFPERILAIDSGIDVSDANAVVGDVLTGKTFYAVDDTKKTGTMADNGTVNTDITTKAQEVTIAGGKHSGSGKVKISSTEQAKIVADNIKSGVSILGQAGGLTPAKEEETKTVTPNFSSGNVVVTPTTDKVMTQVTVNKDTTNHTPENIKDGITLYGVTGTYEGGGGGGGYTLTVNAAGVTYTLIYANGTISQQNTNGTFYNVVAICDPYGINNLNGSVFNFSDGIYKPSISLSYNHTTLLLSDTTLNVIAGGGAN